MNPPGNSLKVPAKTPILLLVRPFQEFAAREASGGILLLATTVIALCWANSPWADSYTALWHTRLAIGIGSLTALQDLHFLVNDALMAIFFLVVSLEIKRELLVGELASPRKAALPILAALGGVLAPAIIYVALNTGGPGKSGWGIPMATDIAFAIGVMALLGERAPLGLKIFLTALAIVDDIAAVIVIALFYTAGIDLPSLALAGVCMVALIGANRLGVRHPLPYALLGILLWLAVIHSGVHATIAGVALAMTIPSRTILNPEEFLVHGRAVLDHFETASARHKSVMNDEEPRAAIEALEDACEQVQPPLRRMEQALHPWVTFLIMPIFALANAGVAFQGGLAQNLSHPISLGVVLGLMLGKPIGITLASWAAVKTGLARLPAGVTWGHVHGAGWLGGIGFTMSLFIAGLAFKEEPALAFSKIGILTGSLGAGIVGSALLVLSSRSKP